MTSGKPSPPADAQTRADLPRGVEGGSEGEAAEEQLLMAVHQEPAMASAWYTLADVHEELGRLDDAVRACAGHAAVAEINVGYQLIEHERWADAEKLLKGVCPLLKGQSTEGNCLQLLEYARSRQ